MHTVWSIRSRSDPYFDETTQKTFTSLKFTPFSGEEIEALSQVHVVNGQLYTMPDRRAKAFGALDPRLGVCDKTSSCGTCGLQLEACPGHFGYVRLELPVFQIGYFKSILEVVKMVCKTCARVLLDEPTRLKYLTIYRRKTGLDIQRRKAIHKKLIDLCKKKKVCDYCGSVNGDIKKMNPLRIYHHLPVPKKGAPATDSQQAIQPSLRVDMNPLVMLQLFEKIRDEDLEVLDMDTEHCHPARFIMTHLLVPPVCIRPSVSGTAGTTEDDLTVKITEIVKINTLLAQSAEEGVQLSQMITDWDFLQVLVALYVMGDVPGLPLSMAPPKVTRSFCSRLKGKQGRFRGHLNGKRVDFSARTVISPDPNLSIEEVGVPDRVARIMTYPERVTQFNLHRLQTCVINGADQHPGANFVETASPLITNNTIYGNSQPPMKYFLRFVPSKKRAELAHKLKVGDIVERHMDNGDIVLFNRQPSLHKLSIMSHIVRVRPWRTFRFNECVCTPYNADFDGDEMNLHLPQTEEARAEAALLMRTSRNIVTPRNGEPIIAATQDFITASYLLTHKDTFMTRAKFVQTISFFGLMGKNPSTGPSSQVGLPTSNNASLGWDLYFDLPPPAIVRPVALWTGKQVFSLLIRPNNKSPVVLNLGTASRSYLSLSKSKGLHERCPNDGFVLFRNSELLAGTVDKALVGGSKESVYHALLRDYGATVCGDRMSRMARLCARYLGDRGFSIGIDDVTPPKILVARKENLVSEAYAGCDTLIAQYAAGQLKAQAGSTPEQTLEAMVTKQLSDLREEASKICRDELPRYNAPMIMLTCGSKGSNINVSQMIACVAQQTVNGARIPNGFDQRTLPYFARNSRDPPAKGFVRNSFFSGMNPTEFFFHTMGGREGLVDTAVKVAETGYMQRRLMKSLEDLCVVYDTSVRNSMGNMIQFTYGDDALDPADMEGKDFVVDLHRLWTHTVNVLSAKNAHATNGRFKGCANRDLVKEENGDGKSHELRCVACIATWVAQHRGQCTQLFFDAVRSFVTSQLATFGSLYPTFATDATDATDASMQCPEMCLVGSFLKECSRRYNGARIEAGTAVGALAAQSIGEPGTQMTLKTFHFAGVASMSVTLGVPRIKEIINASKKISTPIIYAELDNPQDMKRARAIQGSLERAFLKDIAMDVTEVYTSTGAYLSIRLDLARAELLKLPVNSHSVKASIMSRIGKKLLGAKLTSGDITIVSLAQLRIALNSPNSKPGSFCGSEFYTLQRIKKSLPELPVCGLAHIKRAVIRDMGKNTGYNIAAEGTDLLQLMATRGIKASTTKSNHVMDNLAVLGIEAARVTIITQIAEVMDAYGLKIDCRHLMLLSDLMTCKGTILGITRFGLVKMRDSVLMAASFEKVTDILFDAAQHGRVDPLEGVSECIIMGKTMSLGTGLFKLIRDIPAPDHTQEGDASIVYKKPPPLLCA